MSALAPSKLSPTPNRGKGDNNKGTDDGEDDAREGGTAATAVTGLAKETVYATDSSKWGGQSEGQHGGGDGGGSGGRSLENRFSSWASFGSVTQGRPARMGLSAWSKSIAEESSHYCCDCVPLTRGLRGSNGASCGLEVGVPSETHGGGGGGSGSSNDPPQQEQVHPPAGKGGREGGGLITKNGFRPRHRRGHSAGPAIAAGGSPAIRTAYVFQPQGWEMSAGGASGATTTTVDSGTTSATSSSASAALAAAAAAAAGGSGGSGGSLGPWGREAAALSWGRRSGSWGAGGVAAADREFHRILKAGVDVFKHSSTRESGPWQGVVPKRIKELLSRSCPLEDENQGLVTLFLDKERENFCWCSPGAAELVPDERYRLSVGSLSEVIPGNETNPRLLTLRAAGRANPLVFELDSDELYDILSKGIVRILERNHIRETLMMDPSTNAI